MINVNMSVKSIERAEKIIVRIYCTRIWDNSGYIKWKIISPIDSVSTNDKYYMSKCHKYYLNKF